MNMGDDLGWGHWYFVCAIARALQCVNRQVFPLTIVLSPFHPAKQLRRRQ